MVIWGLGITCGAPLVSGRANDLRRKKGIKENQNSNGVFLRGHFVFSLPQTPLWQNQGSRDWRWKSSDPVWGVGSLHLETVQEV